MDGSQINQTIDALGLAGGCVCIHSSLRSFGFVEGGARSIVDSFLSKACTILVPTFTDSFRVPPPLDLRPPRNGCAYDGAWAQKTAGDSATYSTSSAAIDKDMGAIPAEFIRMPDRSRGTHAINSFAAAGPCARELIAEQSADNVFAPLSKLTERNGLVILMGVDLRRMTLLHLAEKVAGRQLFRRWANGPDGKPMMWETGGCSSGFQNLEPILSRWVRRVRVGQSEWMVAPAREILDAAAAAIRNNPAITHCGDAVCERCRDAQLGGPILSA